jgi:hypothetical protein
MQRDLLQNSVEPTSAGDALQIVLPSILEREARPGGLPEVISAARSNLSPSPLCQQSSSDR